MNGTNARPALLVAPSVLVIEAVTASWRPRAWASIERPAEDSANNTVPPPPAPIHSRPVRAITVRPAVTVALMWQR